MEDLLKELVVETPSLVGIIVIAWLFLRALATRDKTIGDIAKLFSDTTRESVDEMKSLKEVIGANSEVIKRCHERLKR